MLNHGYHLIILPSRKPISLISHSDIRHRGTLAGIDPQASTIQLDYHRVHWNFELIRSLVYSMGTESRRWVIENKFMKRALHVSECRPPREYIAPVPEPYAYIVFGGEGSVGWWPSTCCSTFTECSWWAAVLGVRHFQTLSSLSSLRWKIPDVKNFQIRERNKHYVDISVAFLLICSRLIFFFSVLPVVIPFLSYPLPSSKIQLQTKRHNPLRYPYPSHQKLSPIVCLFNAPAVDGIAGNRNRNQVLHHSERQCYFTAITG